MGDGDALQIDVTVHQDGDDAILIAVADNGVGMDEGTAARCLMSAPPAPMPVPRKAARRRGHAQYF